MIYQCYPCAFHSIQPFYSKIQLKARLSGFNVWFNMHSTLNQMLAAFEQVVQQCRKRKKNVKGLLNQI